MKPVVPSTPSMTALLTVREGGQSELAQALRGLAADLDRQSGCRSCVLAQDVGGGPSFLLHVAWTDLEALRRGMASEPHRVLMGALSTLASVELLVPYPALVSAPRALRPSPPPA